MADTQVSRIAIHLNSCKYPITSEKLNLDPKSPNIYSQSAIVAGATIGAFSWNAVANAYWLALAFWYASLILSILAIMLAAQQVAVLQILGKPPTSLTGGYKEKEEIRRFLPLMLSEDKPSRRRLLTGSTLGEDNSSILGKWRPRWKMVFVWQCPMMFLSYSISAFLLGLTLFVCTPLIRNDSWNTSSNVSSALSMALFLLLTPSS